MRFAGCAMNRLRYLLLPLLLAFALVPGGADAASTERASISSAGVEGNFDSVNPDISADGRFVVFESFANTLHPDDAEFALDIFARDQATDTTALISRASGAAGANSNGSSLWAATSADGRFVAFESTATNLDAADIDSVADIYVRDRASENTFLVSRANGGGGAKANGASAQSDISGASGIVAFQSAATNLDAADADTSLDIFIRDIAQATTEYVSRASGAAGVASNGSSEDASLNGDGTLVVFESTATNLHPDDADIPKDVYLRDRIADTTILVSRASGVAGAKGNGASVNGYVSADGRYVAFQSQSTNLHPDDSDTAFDIYVRDLVTNTTMLVSRASGTAGEAANASAVDPYISFDGRFITFDSGATNLTPGDTNGISDIFVRDIGAEYTVRASLDADGSQVFNGNPTRPAIAGDGRGVAFYSDGNFVPDDTNFDHDVMVRTADDDDDLILEPADNCSTVPNASQTDTDADGLGDACDDDDDGDGAVDSSEGCDLLPEDVDAFEDGDGCPEYDNDADGVCDPGQTSVSCTGADMGKLVFDPAGTLPAPTLDCRNQPEDLDAFKDSDGCPESDNDNDGFPDVTDDCPGTDSRAGADGMLGSPQDLNHNGIRDGAEAVLTTDDVMPALVWEDSDGVLDTDGCHDSPGDDFDGDGLTDNSEVFTHLTNAAIPDTDADGVIDGPDNCRLWPNPAQALPPNYLPLVGSGPDSDCDRFTNSRETYLTTDATKHCAASTTANNEPPPDLWPLDMNDDRRANTVDVGAYVGKIGLDNTEVGWTARLDLNQSANGIINTADVGFYVGRLGNVCSPTGP
jgi:hypothetical protein